MSASATDLSIGALRAEADRLFSRKRIVNFGLPGLAILYLICPSFGYKPSAFSQFASAGESFTHRSASG